MRVYRSPSRLLFEIFLYTGFTLFCLAIILPFLHVIALSLSTKKAYFEGKVLFWPVDWYTKPYAIILTSKVFLTSLRNTVLIVVVNTSLQIFFALCAGYALANKHFFGTKVAFIYILIPMYFGGGLIPFYLIVNSYGLNNRLGALVFPYLVSIFYIIVFRNAISQLPKEIMESAEMDGASGKRKIRIGRIGNCHSTCTFFPIRIFRRNHTGFGIHHIRQAAKAEIQ